MQTVSEFFLSWKRPTIVKSLGVAALLVALGSTVSCVRTNDYVLTAGTVEGWVIIELANPACPEIVGRWHREFVVPSSAYLCTSTGPTQGLVYERYWLMDVDGRRTRIKIGQDVHARSDTEFDFTNCQLAASIFWYGKGEAITADVSSVIRKRNPECQ